MEFLTDMSDHHEHRTDWKKETLVYDVPHPRLKLVARLLEAMPYSRLLDVGCSTGTLRRILPDAITYFGCDITDHARAHLDPGRFLRIDFNDTTDLSFFSGRDINMINISGVLEYLRSPGDLLTAVRGLVPEDRPLVVSIINFDGARFSDPVHHHPSWIYRPGLDEFRALLARTGWDIEQELPLLRGTSWRAGLRQWLARRRGADHPDVRRAAAQFVLVAKSV